MRIGVLAFAVALSFTTLLDTASSKVSRNLLALSSAVQGNQSNPGDPAQVIGQYRVAPIDPYRQKIELIGECLHRILDVIKAAHYQMPAPAILNLADDMDVNYSSWDRPVQGRFTRRSRTAGCRGGMTVAPGSAPAACARRQASAFRITWRKRSAASASEFRCSARA
jgi:hypothetical protein